MRRFLALVLILCFTGVAQPCLGAPLVSSESDPVEQASASLFLILLLS